MSTTVDNRVVEMRFDNKHFESNVQTSLSTIEKLKQSLNFSNVSKSFDNLNSASRRFDISPMSAGIETVRAKFSALEVMGVTALANITNSAVNAGKRMVSALTIDPIKTGFSEYETKINAVQTIMSNTASKGTTMADVTKTLNELNVYADKTIYNFAEMTRNIGTFTAAGVGLEDSAAAIQGIANLAAASGSTSQQASTAMYQLSQALAAGKVQLMDWNSVVNAGMGGEKFQEALKATAREHGIAVDDMINKAGSFRESLKKGWITTDVLNDTLKKFTVEGAKEYADAMVKSGKYTKEQADALVAEAEAMNDAATKVKTFTQLWDTMKESVQSGWAQTWELLIGDFEEAKEMLSSLSDFFGGIIEKFSHARNYVLESALGKTITGLGDKLNAVGKVAEPIKEAADAVKDLGDIVNKVIVGDFGNGADRIKALTEAGYDYATVQNKVNEKLGSTFRHTEKVTGAQKENADAAKEQTDATIELNDEEKERLKGLLKMTEAELKAKGYTDEQIEALRELGEQAKKLGVPIDDFIDNLDKLNGRFLLINGFKNIGRALVTVFTTLGNAWNKVFNPPTLDEQADGLFNVITAFSRFTSKLVPTGDDVEKLTRTFEGLFAALDIILTITGGGLRVAFELFKAVLSVLDIDILDITAAVGDAIVGFKEWLDKTLDFTGAIEYIAPIIAGAVTAVRDWVDENVDLAAAFDTVVSTVKGAIDGFRGWIDSLKESENLPKDIADGIVNGFGKALDFVGKVIGELGKSLVDGFNGVPGDCIAGFVNGIWEGIKVAGQVVFELGKTILAKIKEVLGIHSPSKEFFEIAWNCITGFINGLWDAVSGLVKNVWDIGKGLLDSFAEGVQNGQIDFGTIFAGVVSGGLVLGFLKIADGIKNIGSAFEGLGDLFEGAGKVLNSFSGVLKSVSFGIKAEAIKSIATAIAILAGSLFVLTLADPERLKAAGVALGVLMAGMMGLIAVLGKTSKSVGDGLEQTFDVAKIAGLVLAITGAMVLMAYAAKIMGDLKPDAFNQGLIGVAAFAVIITALIYMTQTAGPMIGQIGTTMLAIAGAMILMAYAVKTMGDLNDAAMGKGMLAIVGFFGIIALLIVVSQAAGPFVGQIGASILSIAGAMVLMGLVVKALGSLDPTILQQGVDALWSFVLIIGVLAVIVSIAGGKSASGIGVALLGIAGAIAILAIVAVALSYVDVDALNGGIFAVLKLAGIVAALVVIVGLLGNDAPKIAATILAISIAIGVLAAIAVVLSFINPATLENGINAVASLALIMTMLIAVTSIANGCTGTIVALTVAMAVLVAAVVILSSLNPDNMWPAVGAVAALVGVLAILVAATSLAKGSMGVLIVITVAIAALGIILYALAQLPVESVIGSAIALGGLMLVLTGVIAVLSLLGSKTIQALAGVIALLALCVPLVALVGILYLMDGLQNAQANATALSIFAGVLTLLLIPLALVGALVAPALLGVVALLALCVPLVALVGILALMENLQNAETNIALLTKMLTTMTAVLVVLAIVGPLALIGVAAMAALTALIVAMGALAVGIGALMTEFPQLEEFLNKGIPILEQLAYAIGSLVGNVIAGFVDAVAQCKLPELGTMLSQFMINAMPFVTLVKMVDDQVLAGVGILAASVLALTAADLVAGIGSFLTGGSSFATLGTELSQFMTNAKPFMEGMKSIDPSIADSASAIASMILVLTGASLLEQLTSWLTGESSLSGFAEELVPFGEAMAAFSEEVKDIDPEAVTAAANAGKILAEMASALPNSGGILGSIMGENDMDTFGEQLKVFGEAIAAFSDEVKDVDSTAVEAAANAGKVMTGFADTIPNSGGFIGSIMGENDMDTFGEQMVAFGKAIAGFSDEVKDIDSTAIEAAANAGKIMTGFADTIPNSGGIIAEIMGENDMDTFGEQMVSFGEAIVSFADKVAGLDTDAVEAAANAGTIMTTLANNLPESGGFLDIFTGGKTSLEDFGKQMASFGSSIAAFSTNTAAVDAVKLSSVVYQVDKLVKLLSGMNGVSFTGADSFANALGTLGNTSVDEFVKAFTGSADKVSGAGEKMMLNLESGVKEGRPQIVDTFKDVLERMLEAVEDKHSKFKSAGTDVMIEFGDGIKRSKDKLHKSLSPVLTSMVNSIEDKYSSFKSAGKYLVEGFASGISANTFKAEAKARAMANAALEAAEDALDVNSPSKKGYKIGNFFGMGFVGGIEEFVSRSYSAGYGMADRARLGLSDAISKVKNFIDADIDTQPTIRPVLDLSDVKSGVGAIDGMFGINPSIGVLNRVNSIAPMMNRGQNGASNDDVVSAINDLGAKISGSSGDSYNVNGITYDDGSNISNAVKTLVRAARVERRI